MEITHFSEDPKNIFFRCVEDSDEAIMITNTKAQLVYVNPAWERTYGYPKAEAIGRNPNILHSGQHSKDFYSAMWKRIAQTGSWKGEVINRAKNGKFVPVMLSITPFRDQGVIQGYMGIALDMTQKRELEAKIAQQDRLASIGLLASGLAHEIGTPLGVIRGRAEFLQMLTKKIETRETDSGGFAASLEVIVGQIDRISKLIRSLLRVSRKTSDLNLKKVKVFEAVSDILGLVGQNLRADKVSVENLIPPECEVYCDFDRLEQVLLNLLMNSVHAIRKAKEDPSHRVAPDQHRLSISHETVHRASRVYQAIKIADTGCGISKENLDKIFRPFFTTKSVGEGTGLGLAISLSIMNEMGGEIRVESEVGLGSSFSLLFPQQSLV